MRSCRILCLLFILLMTTNGWAEPDAVPDRLLVRFENQAARRSVEAQLAGIGLRPEKQLVPDLVIWAVHLEDAQRGLDQALIELRALPGVRYAQKDHRLALREAQRLPDDPNFSLLWNFHNSNDADIDAPEAWALIAPTAPVGGTNAAGEDIVIAVIDDGFQTDHTDFAANLWINSHETKDGIDNDGNGYIDDINGWNVYDTNASIPINSHGTHVAGILGAVGNNARQLAGLNWRVKVMTVAGESETTSIVTAAYAYVIAVKRMYLASHGQKGANVVATNSSFGVDFAKCANGDYPIWNDLYNEMGSLGILSAAATMNNGSNVDVSGDVPTSCDSPYIISVTATNSSDQRSYAYGATTIDLGAPGVGVYSLVPTNSFGSKTGTSMAAPHVAGAVGFLHAVASPGLISYYHQFPDSAALQMKKMILSSVDSLPTLSGATATVSGGRLNLYKAALLARDYGQGSGIQLTVDTDVVKAGQSILLPIRVVFPPDTLISAFELRLNGEYQAQLEFKGVVTANSLTGLAGWQVVTNERQDELLIAGIGAKDIKGEGVLFWLNFQAREAAQGFVPVEVQSALFNTGEVPVQITSGGLWVLAPGLYGDVDLNEAVQAYDAALVLKHLVGLLTLNPQQERLANVTSDTTLSALDASIILQYVVELIGNLPYDTTDTFNATGQITMPRVETNPGKTVIVPLTLSHGANIFAFEAEIAYDPAMLEFVDIVWPPAWDGFTKSVNKKGGVISVAGASALADGAASIFAELHFTTQQDFSDGETAVRLLRLRWNEDPVMLNSAEAVIHSKPLGIEEPAPDSLPFALQQSYPNPFNDATVIRFSLPAAQHITLKIYDTAGRLIHTLIEADLPAGPHQVTFKPTQSNLASGIYFYELRAGSNLTARKKMVLLRS